MRSALNSLYRYAELLAMALLVTIAGLVLAQIIGRILDSLLVLLGSRPLGLHIPSLAEIAGFLMVGASFLALAGALRGGAHIRVTLLVTNLPSRLHALAEFGVLLIGTCLSAYFCWYGVKLVLDSYRFNELSYGIIAIPIWIPQAVMTAGIGIFTMALIDDLLALLSGGEPSYVKADAGRREERDAI